MSEIDNDFDSIVEKIHNNIKVASELLVEASKLSINNNIVLDPEDIENIQNIINDLTPSDWSSSENSSWVNSCSTEY